MLKAILLEACSVHMIVEGEALGGAEATLRLRASSKQPFQASEIHFIANHCNSLQIQGILPFVVLTSAASAAPAAPAAATASTATAATPTTIKRLKVRLVTSEATISDVGEVDVTSTVPEEHIIHGAASGIFLPAASLI